MPHAVNGTLDGARVGFSRVGSKVGGKGREAEDLQTQVNATSRQASHDSTPRLKYQIGEHMLCRQYRYGTGYHALKRIRAVITGGPLLRSRDEDGNKTVHFRAMGSRDVTEIIEFAFSNQERSLLKIVTRYTYA